MLVQLQRLPADKREKVSEALNELQEAGLSWIADLATIAKGKLEAGDAKSASASHTSQHNPASTMSWGHTMSWKRVVMNSIRRVDECTRAVLAKAFAFSFFFASRWLQDKVGEGHQEAARGICLAAVLSCGCFMCIWVMDKVADRLRDVEGVTTMRESIRLVISVIGVIIGFAWKQAFAKGIKAVSVIVPEHQDLIAAILSTCSVLLVAPAWRLYISPMVVQEGWRFGFDVYHVTEKARAIADWEPDNVAQEFAKKYRELLHELQVIHHVPHDHHDANALEDQRVPYEPDIDTTTGEFYFAWQRARSNRPGLVGSHQQMRRATTSAF